MPSKPPSPSSNSAMVNLTLFPPAGGDAIPGAREYYRIGNAAEMLRCTPDDLLHLGAIGNVEISAPVVNRARFEWPVGNANSAFPEIEGPFVWEFDATDRVYLSVSDLAHIEAVGWVIPRLFYAPAKARLAIKNNHTSLSEALAHTNKLQQEKRQKADMLLDAYRIQLGQDLEMSDEFKEQSLAGLERNLRSEDTTEEEYNSVREHGFHCAWHVVNSHDNSAERTTVEHLFLSKDEVQRLLNGQPQTEAACQRKKSQLSDGKSSENGHVERHAAKREAVLSAAICVQNNFLKKIASSQIEWAKLIDEKAHLFWPDLGEPPLSLDKIERLLGDALRLPTTSKKT